MLNLSLFRFILLNALLMMALCLFAVWTFYTYQRWELNSFTLLLIMLHVFGFTYSLSRRNEQLTRFFAAVGQSDTAISFPTEVQDRSQRRLHVQLNRVNKIIQDIKLKNSAQEQYYRTLLNQAGTGMLVVDEQGNIPTINSRALELMGRQYLRHLDQLKAVDLHLYQTIKAASAGEKQLVALQLNEQLTQLTVSTTRIVTLGKSYRIITLQDIRNELDQWEIDAWIKLIRVITHEIANTTGPLIALSRSMQERVHHLPADDHRQFLSEALSIIVERSESLAAFVGSYRKLMKVPTPVLRPVSAAAIIDKIRILMSAQLATERVVLQVQICPSTPMLLVDEGLFTQALLNLIKNAMEALREKQGGIIRIEVQPDQSGAVRWNIIDNGPGLPKEHLQDIFVPFFTNKEEGNGIGLSLSRQILRLHGGSLSGCNAADGGAVFSMVVPQV